MARAHKKPQLIEFKGTTLPVVSVTLHTLNPAQLATTASDLFGDAAFFDGDAAVLELEQIDPAAQDAPDWTAIRTILGKHGLQVVGVRGASETLSASAAAAGLPGITALKRPSRPVAEPATAKQPETQAAPPPAPAEPPPAPPPPAAVPTVIIDRPLRSGQQVYARGGDLVVLAAVNAGAEVIADGSIHIYAPLRGRALAGASGETGARIFTTRFEAELVSIAGVYRTFEAGIPDALAGKPVQVQLGDATEGGASPLLIKALKTD
ncbi:septum site-determining protein MinC [Propionivibrio sp.]|uniref:septum site-determining protein MinC n=1 Tax=Propionivibrio sp. TaxID=2212460 RepID=UPI00272E4261|nr:septum site-determining protein MinC [Propionivibrio sp.]